MFTEQTPRPGSPVGFAVIVIASEASAGAGMLRVEATLFSSVGLAPAGRVCACAPGRKGVVGRSAGTARAEPDRAMATARAGTVERDTAKP